MKNRISAPHRARRPPHYLGLRAVIAKSFARIHWQNLANFGVLALEFADAADYDRLEQGDVLVLDGLREALPTGQEIAVLNVTQRGRYAVRHRLSARQIEMVLIGGQVARLSASGRLA
jgi:aconitate hydratase